MTTEQIAIAMNWLSESGKPAQSKASRRMTELFGSDAMEKYRSMLVGNIKKGFRKTLGDGSRDIDAIYEDNDPDERGLD